MRDPGTFTHTAAAARVVFGSGSLRQLAAETARIGVRRALVVTTPGRAALGAAVAGLIADGSDGSDARDGAQERIEAEVHPHAVMHVPVAVVDRAVQHAVDTGADGVVSVGGGSSIGLGKAIALRTGLPVLAVPTTYSGSEMTSVWGLTQDGRKTTGTDPRVQARTVIYDPDLTTGFPVPLSVASALNALAHAAESLYAPDTSPVVELLAEEAVQALYAGLPAVVADPRGAEGRAETLYGAWLAGTCLGATTMSLHHKLCHVLGGAFNLPHAETHALVLPHVLRYNLPAAPRAEAVLRRALGTDDVAHTVHELTAPLGGRSSLRDLGMPEDGIESAVRLAVDNPYANPRPVTADAVRSILTGAYAGTPPAARH